MKTHLLKHLNRLILFVGFLSFCSISAAKSKEEKANSYVNIWNMDIEISSKQKNIVRNLAINFINSCDSIDQLKSLQFANRIEMKNTAHKAFLLSIENSLSTNQKQQLKSKKSEKINAINDILSIKITKDSTNNSSNDEKNY